MTADSDKLVCANCGQAHGVLDECMVGVIAGVVASRIEGEFTDEEIDKVVRPIFNRANIDEMWETLGPIIDEMEHAIRRELGKQPGRRPDGSRL